MQPLVVQVAGTVLWNSIRRAFAHARQSSTNLSWEVLFLDEVWSFQTRMAFHPDLRLEYGLGPGIEQSRVSLIREESNPAHLKPFLVDLRVF
jgi:hypothetical protein